MKTKRALIRSIIIVLVAILGLLIYYYFALLKPRREGIEGKAPKETIISHIKTIYGPSPGDKFKRPHSIALDTQNNIYVTDTNNSRVVVFDKEGEFKFLFGKKAAESEILTGKKIQGKLYWPVGIAVDNSNGNIFVSDEKRHTIIVFNKTGKYLREWLVMSPTKLNILGDKLFATTYGPVYIFDKNGTSKFGKVIKKFGKNGRGKLQFYYANGIGFSNDKDTFYVPDSNNNRIYAFNMNSEPLWISGVPSKKIMDIKVKYEVPVGITVDENDLIYSTEFLGGAIAVISKKGKKIAAYGEMGSRNGEFAYPSDIQYMGNRRFVIADKGLDRLQIIELPIDSKMSKAIEKETGKKVAPTTGESIFTRIINFFKTLLGL